MSQPTVRSQTSTTSPMSEAARETAGRVVHTAAGATQDYAHYYVAEPAKDLIALVKDYARDKPDVAAMWAFGLGVLVGWKLKP